MQLQEIIQRSDILFTRFTLMVTSCISIVQYYNEEIDTDTITNLIQISPLLHELVYVCLVQHNFIICVFQ